MVGQVTNLTYFDIMSSNIELGYSYNASRARIAEKSRLIRAPPDYQKGKRKSIKPAAIARATRTALP